MSILVRCCPERFPGVNGSTSEFIYSINPHVRMNISSASKKAFEAGLCCLKVSARARGSPSDGFEVAPHPGLPQDCHIIIIRAASAFLQSSQLYILIIKIVYENSNRFMPPPHVRRVQRCACSAAAIRPRGRAPGPLTLGDSILATLVTLCTVLNSLPTRMGGFICANDWARVDCSTILKYNLTLIIILKRLTSEKECAEQTHEFFSNKRYLS